LVRVFNALMLVLRWHSSSVRFLPHSASSQFYALIGHLTCIGQLKRGVATGIEKPLEHLEIIVFRTPD
jgi:hypothetical protein